jgi:hypothetical protein
MRQAFFERGQFFRIDNSQRNTLKIETRDLPILCGRGNVYHVDQKASISFIMDVMPRLMHFAIESPDDIKKKNGGFYII